MEQRPSGGFAAATLLGEVSEGVVETPSDVKMVLGNVATEQAVAEAMKDGQELLAH